MRKRWLFLIALLASMSVTLGWIYLDRPRPNPAHNPLLTELTPGIFVTAQLLPASFTKLQQRGIRAVIDMRPDGEAADQPMSADMQSAAEDLDIKFDYIPVPHEGIPAEAVDGLVKALAQKPRPAVLYCRTGRRAVRLFALAEASREDGPSAEQLQQMVQKAGFAADDLSSEIEQRIAARTKSEATP